MAFKVKMRIFCTYFFELVELNSTACQVSTQFFYRATVLQLDYVIETYFLHTVFATLFSVLV